MKALDKRASALMMASKAPSTWKKYQAEFRKFKEWATSRGFTPLPANTQLVIRYLTFWSEGRLANSLATASAAIAAFHKLNRHPSPCANPQVAALLEGARRTFSQPTVQKEPLTKQILLRIWETEVGEDLGGTLWDWRNCWLLTLIP